MVAPGNEADEEDEGGSRNPWPCSDRSKHVIAQQYANLAEAKRSVKHAFQKNKLFASIVDHKEAATKRAWRSFGTGVPSRGYLDWEFADGTLGCRLIRAI